MLLISFLGMLATHFSDVRNDHAWHGHQIEQANFWKAKIISIPEEKDKSYKVIAEINAAYQEDKALISKGKSLVYLSKDPQSARLREGDVIFMRHKLKRINFSGNPGSFDYRKYMEYRHIYYQAFLYKNDWKIYQQNQISLPGQWIRASLKYENNLFNKYLRGDQEIALAKALMTGDRRDLDKDLVQAYSNAGVVHIMSISGLHIGLIYIFLIQMVKVLPRISKSKVARAIIVLSGIWFFAVLTGCSPSVMRSAVMFTCLHAGTLLNRKIPTYNFWSASAYLLLIADPMLLWNVGFQLSYTAVLGILVAQKPIYHWIIFQNKLVDYCWQLVSVSLAAQLFTLPICMYYFHQVPLLFLLANLVAIPLSSIGLWLSLVLILTGWLPLIPLWLGTVITMLYRWLNQFINYIDSFSFTVWNGIYLNLVETYLIMIVIIFSAYWLLNNVKPALKASIVFCCLLAISFVFENWRASNQHRLIVYNLNSTNAIDIISGRKYFEILEVNEHSTMAHSTLATARQYYGANQPDTVQKSKAFGENIYYPGKIPLLIIKSARQLHNPPKERIKLRAILLATTEKVKIADLHKFFEAEVYIFSPLNKRYQIEKWKKECEDLHLPSHDIAVQGAIVMN